MAAAKDIKIHPKLELRFMAVIEQMNNLKTLSGLVIEILDT
jgi:hypothetical protein